MTRLTTQISEIRATNVTRCELISCVLEGIHVVMSNPQIERSRVTFRKCRTARVEISADSSNKYLAALVTDRGGQRAKAACLSWRSI